jgi:hypothetical protein
MKKFLAITLTLLCATAILVQAQDAAPKKKGPKLTPEQKQVMDDMLAKYDTNKDGKLDKTERAAMTQEDKDKMTKAGLGAKKKAADAATSAATNAPAATK